MGMFDNYNISASAMQAQKFRVDIINTNIANSNTVMTENGEGPYKRRDVFLKKIISINKTKNKYITINK